MITSVNYDSDQGLRVRLRDTVGRYHDFTTQSYRAQENATTRLTLAEYPNGDGMSLYMLNFVLPAGAVIQEVVTPDGVVVASGEAVEAATSDPLATIVPGSDPPITRGQAIDKLYVPDYEGPIAVIPANNDPDTQFVHFFAVEGDGSPAEDRKVRAVPLPHQVIDQSLIAKQELTAKLDLNGYAHLELLRGITYTISAPWWGESFEITVTDESNRSAALYYTEQEAGL